MSHVKRVAEATGKGKRSEKTEAKSEFELANEQALKDAEKGNKEEPKQPAPEKKVEPKEEPKQPEPAKEEPKQEEPEIIPEGACEVYGQVDLNSKACKNCPALEQCKVKSKAVAAAKGSTAKGSSPRPRTARVAGTGEFTKFGHCKINSQAGQIEAALEMPHTIDEIAAMTGCTASRIKSHINWLVSNHKDRCTKVMADGKVHFVVNEAAAA